MDVLHTVVGRFLYITEILMLPEKIRKFVPQKEALMGSYSLYVDLSSARDSVYKRCGKATPEELKVKVKFDDSEKYVPKEYKEWKSEIMFGLPFDVCNRCAVYGTREWFAENPVQPGTQAALKLDAAEILTPSIVIKLLS